MPASALSSIASAVLAFARDGFVSIGSAPSRPASVLATAAAFRSAVVYWFQWGLHILPSPSFWLGWTGKSATGGAEPTLLATDPPYGVSLDPTWRDGVYDELGPAEQPYMRTEGHRNTTVSGDTRVDWSDAFALVPSLQVGYVWHAGVDAAEVASGLERIGFEIAAQVIWDKGLFAMGRSWYHWAHEPCWVIRKPGVPHLFHGSRDQSTIWRAPSPKMIMGGSEEEKQDHPAQKPALLYETPIRNHLRAGEACYDPFIGSGTCLVAAETLGRRCYAIEIDPRYVQVSIERWQGLTGGQAVRVDD